MINFKFAIRSLVDKSFFTVLTILQLVISLILIYKVIGNEVNLQENINTLNSKFSNNNYYVVNNEKYLELEDIDIDKLYDLKEYIDRNKDISLYALSETSIFADIEKPLGINEHQKDYVFVNNKIFNRAKAYYISEKYLSDIGLEIIEYDDTFSKSNEDYMPILLGYNYYNVFNLNDLIEYSYVDYDGDVTTKNMIVTGFINKNSNIAENGSGENIRVLDDYIILPYELNRPLISITDENSLMIQKLKVFNYITMGYYFFEKESSLTDLIDFSSKIGIDLDIIKLDKNINKYNKEFNAYLFPFKLMSIIMITFTILSFIMVLSSMIIRNIKEYIINLLVGATIKDIIIRIFYEIIVIFTISIILTIIFIKIIYKDNPILILNTNNSIKLVLISFCLSILVSLFPIIKIKSLTINEILRRNY
ncbi:hypothetical protein H9660_13830 [Clostridium sp. Sa3CUN1]|uniref:ABC transporter permease n=1 Tax=Clostridium gallinarum TaxID=2762246 RepID=A0ABR8Q741_9CLOT|nr:hypothetical protein [Clostridium gallinarum]MBD7916225.1 hypothetical protein [Clostridium gallinarum]